MREKGMREERTLNAQIATAPGSLLSQCHIHLSTVAAVIKVAVWE